MSMRIQVLHNRECTFWKTTWAMLEELIREKKLNITLGEVLIANDDEARKFHFAGSPQVLIDGQDIDPQAERITNYHSSGCRPYFYHGGFSDYPPRAMLEETLTQTTMTNDQ